MEGPFSEAEKRFLVCEVIKASGLSLGAVVDFIKRNNIEPDWYHMQLPPYRTLGDSMEAAVGLTIFSATQKRKFEDMHDERYAKRQAVSLGVDPALLNTGHKRILPRPPSSSAEPQPPPAQPAPAPQGPKKRGRPSQLDRARRAPPPNLPQIAPRPSDSSNQTAQSSNTDQAPAPAPAPVAQNTSGDLTAGYSTSSRRQTRAKAKSSRAQARNNDRVSPAEAPAADPGLSHSSTPRIMPDFPTVAASQARAVYPAPIEPRPMMTTQPHSSVPGSLPALLDRGSEAPSMQPHYAEAAPQVANSA